MRSTSDDWNNVVFLQICPVEHAVTDWRNWPSPGVETKETRLTLVRLGPGSGSEFLLSEEQKQMQITGILRSLQILGKK